MFAAIEIAVKRTSVSIFQILISCTRFPGSLDDGILYVIWTELELAHWLLFFRPSFISRRNKRGEDVSLIAACHGELEIFEYLIASKKFTHFKDLRNVKGQSALVLAAENGNRLVVHWLVENDYCERSNKDCIIEFIVRDFQASFDFVQKWIEKWEIEVNDFPQFARAANPMRRFLVSRFGFEDSYFEDYEELIAPFQKASQKLHECRTNALMVYVPRVLAEVIVRMHSDNKHALDMIRKIDFW